MLVHSVQRATYMLAHQSAVQITSRSMQALVHLIQSGGMFDSRATYCAARVTGGLEASVQERSIGHCVECLSDWAGKDWRQPARRIRAHRGTGDASPA